VHKVQRIQGVGSPSGLEYWKLITVRPVRMSAVNHYKCTPQVLTEFCITVMMQQIQCVIPNFLPIRCNNCIHTLDFIGHFVRIWIIILHPDCDLIVWGNTRKPNRSLYSHQAWYYFVETVNANQNEQGWLYNDTLWKRNHKYPRY
jgi:hypothetical protein